MCCIIVLLGRADNDHVSLAPLHTPSLVCLSLLVYVLCCSDQPTTITPLSLSFSLGMYCNIALVGWANYDHVTLWLTHTHTLSLFLPISLSLSLFMYCILHEPITITPLALSLSLLLCVVLLSCTDAPLTITSLSRLLSRAYFLSFSRVICCAKYIVVMYCCDDPILNILLWWSDYEHATPYLSHSLSLSCSASLCMCCIVVL